MDGKGKRYVAPTIVEEAPLTPMEVVALAVAEQERRTEEALQRYMRSPHDYGCEVALRIARKELDRLRAMRASASAKG